MLQQKDLLSRSLLRKAVLPPFPQEPTPPEGNPWDRDATDNWYGQMDAWDQAVRAFRPEPLRPEFLSALASFAASATPAAISPVSGKNALFSPVSLWLALAMLARCAGGESRRQVLQALNRSSLDTLTADVNHLWRALYTGSGLRTLTLGGSVWLNESLRDFCSRDTLDALAARFFTDTFAAVFGTAEADRAISTWMARQTRGLIGEGEPVVETKAESLAMLLSSLYYRAAWEDPFDPHDTRKRIFAAADGSRPSVPFLRCVRNHERFWKQKTWQASDLPLQLGTMVFVLPEKGTAPEQLLEDPAFLPALLNRETLPARTGEVHWAIPRFDLSSRLCLNSTLAALGVRDPLDPARADLSPLTSCPACLSQVTQMTRLKLSEDGVEAAAVTILDCMITGLPPMEQEKFRMTLNRPFLFLLEAEGLPLFVGVVNTVDG